MNIMDAWNRAAAKWNAANKTAIPVEEWHRMSRWKREFMTLLDEELKKELAGGNQDWAARSRSLAAQAAASMTPERAMEISVAAGIHNPDGSLTEKYGGEPKP